MTMITPSYLGETIEYSSLHACRSTLEDPTAVPKQIASQLESYLFRRKESLHTIEERDIEQLRSEPSH